MVVQKIVGGTASQKDWDEIDKVLASLGWMSLGRATTPIVIIARDEAGRLSGFSVVQLTPQAGPLWVAPKQRSTGLAEELADATLGALTKAQARGWFVVADSPHVARLCEQRGMKRLESAVYVAGGMGSSAGEAR